MGTVALAIIKAPDERLRAVCRPHRLVVELSRVPHGFIRNLWHADGMRGWAWTGVLEHPFYCVIHVILMVGAIKVHTVPARREMMNSHDASWARFLGEVIGLAASCVDVLQTSVTEAWISTIGVGWATNSHTKALSLFSF